jgi:uncharacterized protein YcbX
MQMVGRVESLWRYPVKSMRGERLSEAFAGFTGIYGDRLYAFRRTGAPLGFPYVTSREHKQMLLYQPRFQRVESMFRVPNFDKVEGLAPVLTVMFPAAADTVVRVHAPDGEHYSIDDPTLMSRISDGTHDRHTLRLVRSVRSLTDCRPVSVFGIWTALQLSDELGMAIDQRRFRANIYIDFDSQRGFAEDELVGQTLRIGSKATIAVLERDPRCKMITLDPETAQENPDVMRCVARNHGGKAGVYAVVLIEGAIRTGDAVMLLD